MALGYTWDKLVDRCLVQVDASKVALKKFLHEGEFELTRKVNILEEESIHSSFSSYLYQLPSNFKEIIAVYQDGIKLSKMDFTELDMDSSNTIRSGTPTRYTVKTSNNTVGPTHQIIFDRNANSVKLKVYYFALAESPANYINPIVPYQYQADLCLYANAMVLKKVDPAASADFMQEWNMVVEQIRGEDSDRDIIYEIKEEI